MKINWCSVRHRFFIYLACCMSQIPLFFHEGILSSNTDLTLHEDTAKHVVQVLRMQPGDSLSLTNGKGYYAQATIKTVQKKNCIVFIHDAVFHERTSVPLHIAVAFTKNTSRNEWILEKVTELGVTTIIPLQTTRSEREKFRYDRWQNILVAAIIQSQQYYMPDLRELTPVANLAEDFQHVPQKLMAHCINDIERQPIAAAMKKGKETLLLIGPEGDFTMGEVNELTSKGFSGISMGQTRLRTETAAVTAAAYFNMLNHG